MRGFSMAVNITLDMVASRVVPLLRSPRNSRQKLLLGSSLLWAEKSNSSIYVHSAKATYTRVHFEYELTTFEALLNA